MFGQSIERARAEGRYERQFWSWSSDDYRIVPVSAFAADDKEPTDGYYWVPQLGFSGGYGYHLFDTRQDAARAAFASISKQIQQLEALRMNIDAT
jgi:hypothetical protein